MAKERIILEIDNRKLRDAIKKIAKKDGRHLKYHVERALQKYIDDNT